MDSNVFKKFGKVAVLGGGNSRERDVSLQSARAVMQAMEEFGVNAEFVDTRDCDFTALKDFDRAFIALHGPGGEDGRIQAVLELLGIPYTGSGVTASAIAMDKVLSKKIWQASNLPIASSFVVRGAQEALEASKQLGFPVIIKPSLEGSSVGISLVEKELDVATAFSAANFPGQEVLVEHYIKGKEFSVGILGDEVLPSVGLSTKRAFYDYQAKYVDDDTEYFCPSGLSKEKENEIKILAMQAFSSLSCHGWGRVDFMQDENGNFYLLEVNTIPGLTSHSLLPMEAKVQGYDFPELIIRILETSLKDAG